MATSYEDFLKSPRVSYSGQAFNPILPDTTGWANVGVQGGGGIQYSTQNDGENSPYLRYFATNGLMPFLSEQNGSLGYTSGQEYDDPQWNALLDNSGNPITRQSLGLDKTYGFDSYDNAKNTFSSGYVPWNIDNVNEGLSNRHPFNLNAIWGGTQYAQGRVTDWSGIDPTQYQANVIAANTRNELWNEYQTLKAQGKTPAKNPDEVALDFYVKNVGQNGNQFGYGPGANTALITEAVKHQFLNSPDVVQARGTAYQTPQEKMAQIDGFGTARQAGVPTWQAFEQQQYGSGGFNLGSLIPMIIGGMALGPMAGAFGGGLAGNALAGALIGGTTAEIGGGDFLKGALTGGVGGGLYSSLGGVAGDGWTSGYDLPMANASGAGELTGLTDLISGANGVPKDQLAALVESLTSGNSSDFGLSGATAGNLAGTGGLSSSAGINGIGQSVGSLLTPGAGTGTSLGLGSGAAGSAALSGAGAYAGSLLTPAMAESAGLLANQAMGGSGLTAAQAAGGTTSVPSFADYIKTGSIDGSTPNPAPQVPSTPVGNGVGLTEAAQAGSGVAAGGSALSRLLDGTATTADYTQLLGGVAGSALGVYGANQQAQSYENVANKFLDMGQPYRDRLNASYAPNFSMANQPDFMNALDLGSESVLKKLSATGGNPYGNAGAMAEANKYVSGSLALPQLNTYRSQLGTFGQLGTNQAGSAMGAQTQAQGSKYDALGYGIGQLTQPDNPFKGLLDQFKYKPSNGWGY